MRAFFRCKAAPALLVCFVLGPVSELRAQAVFAIEVEEAAAAVADAEQPADADPQVAAMMAQTRPQYEALLDGRLHAIRDLCEPTPEQEQALLEQGKRGMEEALRAFAKHTVKHNHGNFVVGFGNRQQRGPVPETQMDRVLAEAVAEHLDAEQQAKHREEQKKRVAHRRRVCAEAITAALDSELLLNEEQRQQLAERLYENWDPNWDGCEKSVMYGSRYLPKVPDKLIRHLLDGKQRQLWQKVGQQNAMIHMGELRLIGGDPNCRIAPFRVREADDSPSEPPEEAS